MTSTKEPITPTNACGEWMPKTAIDTATARLKQFSVAVNAIHTFYHRAPIRYPLIQKLKANVISISIFCNLAYNRVFNFK